MKLRSLNLQAARYDLHRRAQLNAALGARPLFVAALELDVVPLKVEPIAASRGKSGTP